MSSAAKNRAVTVSGLNGVIVVPHAHAPVDRIQRTLLKFGCVADRSEIKKAIKQKRGITVTEDRSPELFAHIKHAFKPLAQVTTN